MAVEQRTANRFGFGFPARPGAEKLVLSFGEIRFPEPSQQNGEIDPFAGAFDIDAHRISGCHRYDRPISGVREIELYSTACLQSRLPVRAVYESEIAGRGVCAGREDCAES